METCLFVLASDQTSPTFEVLGTPWAMARSSAHANLPKLAPMLSDTWGHRARRPSRALATPEELQAAWPGGDRLLMEATERAYHRSQDEAKPREHDRGTKPASMEAHGQGPP